MPPKRRRSNDDVSSSSGKRLAPDPEFVATDASKPPAPAWIVGRPCRVRLVGTDAWRTGTVKEVRGLDKRSLELQLDEDPDFPTNGRPHRVSLDKQPVHVAEDFVWAVEPPAEGSRPSAAAGERTPALLFHPFGPPEAESCGPKGARGSGEPGGGSAGASGHMAVGEFLEVEVAEPTDPSQVSWKPAEVRQLLGAGRFTCCVNGDEDFLEEYGPEDEGTEWRRLADQLAGREAFEAAARASLSMGVQLVLVEFQRSKRRAFVSRVDCLLFVRHMWGRRTPPAQLPVVKQALATRRQLLGPTLSSLKRSLVHKRVGVYWPDDDAWYVGLVVGFDSKANTHGLLYDDGAHESVVFADEAVHVFLDPAEEADFDAYARHGACYQCGLACVLARLPSPEAAAEAQARVDAAKAEASTAAHSAAGDADQADASGSPGEAMEEAGAAPSAAGRPESPRPRDAPYEGDSLQCHGCRDRFHFGCLETNLEARPGSWEKWRCLECKTCEVCSQDGSKIRLAVCEDCDEGYHIGCLDPPLKSFPFRSFKCPKCVRCSSCGTRDAKKWRSDYTMCEPCGRLFKDGKYCPICLAVYKGSDVGMIQCDKCRFWLHARCDGLDADGLGRLGEADAYSCPNCRGERTYTLMSQVLAELQKEDRDKFFGEPVAVEYALAMQYHSVVDRPMDFGTMKAKVDARAYGDVQLAALSGFRDDFALICNNAQAFHRPNERVHLVAKRLLKSGFKRIDTTFPWLKADLVADADAGGGGELAKPERRIEAQTGGAAEENPPLDPSPWHQLAHVHFSPRLAAAGDSCLVCGGLPDETSPWPSDAQLLRCTHCAETFHSYCTPAPCPEPNEEMLVGWSCPRCRLLTIRQPADPPVDAPVDLPAGTARCARCDKVLQRRPGTTGPAPAGGLLICGDCRCCEGCGKMGGRGWSDDGVWCASCAPAGLEERFCGICSRVYDDDSEEAKVMVCCDACQAWVHLPCDGMDANDYMSYAAGEPGFERYECPDCRSEPPGTSAGLWRQLERLVGRIQHKRLGYSAELLPSHGKERSALTDPRRRASLQRWVSERAALGVPWAVEAMRTADSFLAQAVAPRPAVRLPLAGPRPLGVNKHGYYVAGTPADDCGACVYCRDKAKFGGPNVLKKACLGRRVNAAPADALLAREPARPSPATEPEGKAVAAAPADEDPGTYESAGSPVDGEASEAAEPDAGQADPGWSSSAGSWGALASAHAYDSDHSFVDYSSSEDEARPAQDGKRDAKQLGASSDVRKPEAADARPGTMALEGSRKPIEAPALVAHAAVAAVSEAAVAMAQPQAAVGTAAAVRSVAAAVAAAPAPAAADIAEAASAPVAEAAAAPGTAPMAVVAAVKPEAPAVAVSATAAEAAAVRASKGLEAAEVAAIDSAARNSPSPPPAATATLEAAAPTLAQTNAASALTCAEVLEPEHSAWGESSAETAGGDPEAVPPATEPLASDVVMEDAPTDGGRAAEAPLVKMEAAETSQAAPRGSAGADSSARLGQAASGADHPSAAAGASAVPAACGEGAAADAPVCVLCGHAAHPICGRLIPVAPGTWSHANCAVWSSEVFEKEAGVLYNVPSALRRASKKLCAACGLPGASVGCFNKRCQTAYHYPCARAAGCSYTPDDGRSTWCPLHAPPKAVGPLPLRLCRSVAVHRASRMSRSGENEAQLAAVAAANGRVGMSVGGLQVVSLGRPQPARPQFHERHQIFPLGFTTRRRFHDLARPTPATCEYTCTIREHAGLPSFIISHPSDPALVFRFGSPAAAWQALINRRSKVHGVRPLALSPHQARLEGALFFGLAVPAVAQLLEQLPGAKACEGFQPRYSPPEALQKVPPLPKSMHGCARADPYVKRTSAYKALHTVYHRPFINRGALGGGRGAAKEPVEPEESLGVGLRRRDGIETKTAGMLAAATSVSALRNLVYNVKVGRSPIHNWGLFTTCGIPKDAMVVEYKGESMRNVLADLKEKKYGEGALKGQGGDCYMFRLDESTVLDATVKGNVARFMNHCCHPNCYSKVIEVDDDRGPVPTKRKHIVIFAQRDLAPGEEVMYDYKFGVEKEKIACHCGHPKCLGVMN